MHELQIFENPDFGQIRTVEVNGEPWLVGRDVAAALGYSVARKAIYDHVDDEDKRGFRIGTPSGEQEMTIINESGLYALVLSSKLPGAKRFKRWVTSEVLPAVRRCGMDGKEAERMNEIEAIKRYIERTSIQENIFQKKLDFCGHICYTVITVRKGLTSIGARRERRKQWTKI